MVKVKVAAYCRVSTNKKDQENSFENQKSFFEREVANNESYELHRIYSDKGLTGTKLNNRVQFTMMLHDAGLDIQEINGKTLFIPSKREPKFSRILVSNSSRFARNLEVISILRDLRRLGVYVDFLDINKTTENIEDEFIIIFYLNLDQQESINKSKKVKFGMLESAKKGKIFTTNTLFGYSYLPESNELKIIEEEATVIRKIFLLYSQGYGIRRIIAILDEEGQLTRNGKSFSNSTIKRILGNEKYCGILARNKYDCGTVFNKNSYPKVRPESEWIVHEGKIPSIISKELFEECMKIRSERNVDQKGVYKGKSEFAGLILCGNCGNFYTRNKEGDRVYFNCGLKKTKGSKYCDNINVQQYQIDEALFALQRGVLYETFLHDREEKINLLEAMKVKLFDQIDQDKSESVLSLQHEIKELEGAKNRLIDLYVDGKFDISEIDKRREAIELSIKVLVMELTEVSKDNDQIHAEIREIDEQIESLLKLEVKQEYTREEILSLLKCLTITRSNDDASQPFIMVELKVFDLINRLVEKYIDDSKETQSLIRLNYDENHQIFHRDNVS